MKDTTVYPKCSDTNIATAIAYCDRDLRFVREGVSRIAQIAYQACFDKQQLTARVESLEKLIRILADKEDYNIDEGLKTWGV